MNGNELGFYLSTSSSGGVPQSDPFASRGGYPSSTTVYHTESTLSGAMTAKDVAVDNTNSTTPSEYDGAWLMFVTGTNAMEARRIASFDDLTGTFVLEQPFDTLASGGDYYRVFVPEAIFDDIDEVVCGAGQTDYRMVYCNNDSSPGQALTNRWTQIELLDAGEVYLDLSATSDTTVPKDYEPDVFTEPDWDSPWIGSNPYIGGWGQPLASIYSQPPGAQDDWISTEQSALWLRRIVDPATLRSGQAVYLISIGFNESGWDPSPLRAAFLVIFEVAGFNALVDLTADRKIRVKGGCRLTAEVTVQETGEAVAGIPTDWTLDGDGTLYVPDNTQTGDDAIASAVYHSPTDPATEGDPVTFEVRI